MKLGRLQSIAKAWFNTSGHARHMNLRNGAGFSLVEVLLSGALFSLLVTALVGAYLYGQESTTLAGRRARAVWLAKEGLEATRNIRDNSFSDLVDGTYGLATSSNNWILFGSSDTTEIFTRQITISEIDADRKEISSQVTWQQNPQRTGSVVLVSYLTNWQDGVAQADQCDVYCQGQGYDDGVCRQNSTQCLLNGETYESGGDDFCTADPGNPMCCCQTTSQNTCNSYCQSLGRSFGTCRQNSRQCTKNNEVYESGGDQYCPGGNESSCCCSPF